MESLSWHEVLAWVLVFLNVILGIVTWIAKLRWSKEYKDAKEAEIKALKAQINVLEAQVKQLQDLTPMKLSEYVKAISDTLTAYNNELTEEKRKLQEALEMTQRELQEATEKGTVAGARIDELGEQINALHAELDQKTSEIQTYHKFALGFPARFEDANAPLGAWFLLSKSRTEVDPDREARIERAIDLVETVQGRIERSDVAADSFRKFLQNMLIQSLTWAKDEKK
jgi:DNA repair exonuclease SbcCD ATPase subunit